VLTKDRAICIRTVDYSETSQVVTFFTRATGKITCIAKGSKRHKSAFDGTIEIFSHGRVVFSDSNKEKLATLTEFEQEPTIMSLGSNLFALNCALFAAELLEHLTDEYDPHPELFDSLLQFLQNLCDQRAISNQPASASLDASRGSRQRDVPALLILFQLTLLKEVGLQPILNACVNCKNKFTTDWSGIYFSSSGNGLVCKDCEGNFADKVRLTSAAANCLGNLKLIAESKKETLSEIEKVLVYHFTELIGRRPKMAKHILKNQT
jgi:DNA repair protein RecO (recombination protein O)